MSCYEWEAGTIRIPTAEFVRVKRFVQDTAKAYNDKLYAHAQVFWKSIPASAKRDKDKYAKQVHIFVYGNRKDGWDFDPKFPISNGLVTNNDERNGFIEDIRWLLSRMASTGTPRRVKQTDIKPVVNNKTLSFSCGEGHIQFDPKRHTVEWSVGENNHARDYGRNHPIAKALFQVLDTVKWTRGSGGEIVGNDEYNRDSRDSGGGGNYVIDQYGPKHDRNPRPATWGYSSYRR